MNETIWRNPKPLNLFVHSFSVLYMFEHSSILFLLQFVGTHDRVNLADKEAHILMLNAGSVK